MSDLTIVTERHSPLGIEVVTRFIKGDDERIESLSEDGSTLVTILRRRSNELVFLDLKRKLYTWSFPHGGRAGLEAVNVEYSNAKYRVVRPAGAVNVPIQRQAFSSAAKSVLFGKPAYWVEIREERKPQPERGVEAAESIEEGWHIDLPQIAALYPDEYGKQRGSILGSGTAADATMVHRGLETWGYPADVRTRVKTESRAVEYRHRIRSLSEEQLGEDLFDIPNGFRQTRQLPTISVWERLRRTVAVLGRSARF